MKKEKNKFSRIFRKKWFLPAMYLTVAATLLTVVVWYQNLDNQIDSAKDKQDVLTKDQLDHSNEDAKSVLDSQEVILMPVKDQDQAEIVTKFYDYDANEADQEAGLILYHNRYYQSTGISISSTEDKPFDIIASISGTITEVKEDPLLGNVVVMSHENNIKTYYASLAEVTAKVGTSLKQGDTIGIAGKNTFNKDNGIHVHFELRKNGQEVNPEVFFNQPLSKLDELGIPEEKAEADLEEELAEEQEDRDLDVEQDEKAKKDAPTEKESDLKKSTEKNDKDVIEQKQDTEKKDDKLEKKNENDTSNLTPTAKGA